MEWLALEAVVSSVLLTGGRQLSIVDGCWTRLVLFLSQAAAFSTASRVM